MSLKGGAGVCRIATIGGCDRNAYSVVMAQPLTADDLLPLVAKLPHDEQVRLAQLVLRAARDSTRDAAAYRAMAVRPDEFSHDEESAAWEGEGWEASGAPR
jgi:hypothetical protein